MSTPDHNRRVAIGVGVACAAVAGVVTLGIIIKPRATFATIDKVSIKLVLIANFLAIVAYIAWYAYDLFRHVPALGMYRKAIRVVKTVGTLVTLGPPVMFGLEKLVFLKGGQGVPEYTVTVGFAVGGGVGGFIALVAAMIVLTRLYELCEERTRLPRPITSRP